MAYRRRSSYRRGRSTRRRYSSRRSSFGRSRVRRSTGRRVGGRAQTVRIVIEQPASSAFRGGTPVGIGQVTASTPRKATF